MLKPPFERPSVGLLSQGVQDTRHSLLHCPLPPQGVVPRTSPSYSGTSGSGRGEDLGCTVYRMLDGPLACCRNWRRSSKGDILRARRRLWRVPWTPWMRRTYKGVFQEWLEHYTKSTLKLEDRILRDIRASCCPEIITCLSSKSLKTCGVEGICMYNISLMVLWLEEK